MTLFIHRHDIPLLQHPLTAPSAFTADSLVAAVRNERNLSSEAVPRVCALEFDGDLTDWMVAAGHARAYKDWRLIRRLPTQVGAAMMGN